MYDFPLRSNFTNNFKGNSYFRSKAPKVSRMYAFGFSIMLNSNKYCEKSINLPVLKPAETVNLVIGSKHKRSNNTPIRVDKHQQLSWRSFKFMFCFTFCV